MEEDLDFKKYSTQGRIISILALFLIAFGLLFLIVDRLSADTTIELKSIQLKNVKTELNSIERVEMKDSIHEENIKKMMMNYIQSVDKKDISSLLNFYNDTIEEYFLKDNISKSEAKENLIWYFNKYPDSKVIYDTNSIYISNNDQDTTLVIINGIYSRNKKYKTEFISKIKLNKNFKIVSLKDYLVK